MATKINKQRTIKATPAAQAGDDDLVILNPNRDIKIAGKTLTVREYGFIEGLEVRAKAKEFINDLFNLFMDGDVPAEKFVDLIALHRESLLPLIALAADVNIEFLHTLGFVEGDALLALWWGVNGPFFVRMLQERAQLQRIQKQLAAGQTSTANSSPTGMTHAESAATLNDK